MKWRTEALTPGCRAAARELVKLSSLKDFYLAGGSGLALRFGHRVSVDLDFFSDTNPLDIAGRQRLTTQLRALGVALEEEKDGTVHARHPRAHLSFLRYAYPLLRPTVLWEGLRVAHLVDIALMKLGAIIGRGSKKDFLDLHMVLQHELSLTSLLRLGEKKFSGVRDLVLQASRALVYFEDADREPNPKILTSVTWPEVKRFFESQVRKLARPLQ